MTDNTWKVIAVGAVATVVLFVANLTMASQAREPAVTQESFERSASFEANLNRR